jgi:D-beta-D-heptose 7-phosphate kinase/D-beta-D-heptose 1-phosphate adenosyltransferase
VIVGTNELSSLQGTVAMVDGGFDPLHAGHVEYFRAAAELGVPVLCNVTGDAYVSTKHPPLLREQDRAAVIDAIRYIDYVHVSGMSTADVLRRLRPRYYVKGADWRDRLPEEELEVCRSAGIDVVFLDTVTNSSTSLILDLVARLSKEKDADSDR